MTILLSHGRSGHKNDDFMMEVKKHLDDAGVKYVDYNFSYVDSNKNPTIEKLVEEQNRQLEKIDDEVVLIGKSIGARVSAENYSHDKVIGIVALGFPMSKKKDTSKVLYDVDKSMLIINGDKDFLVNQPVLDKILESNSNINEHKIPGNHSFYNSWGDQKSLKKNMATAMGYVMDFLEKL